MLEAVRLVIWDLDETFWRGTIVEGGVDETSHYGAIVKELARRGIMNSICSKNDFEKAKALLEKLGIWEYFIFPSISWDPKGARIQKIIESVKLRPASIMFIDDNPMNLNEAKTLIPELQISDENFIEKILSDERFVGKNDSEFKRLNDYKLLEKKQGAILNSKGDTEDFLRKSNITVEIDYNVEENIDRVIELINRTNQLNFIKKRLPENKEDARKVILEELSHPDRHAGLVHVRDKYGDYGYVGFFLQARGAGYNRLDYFCFSCRTLGMFVELWLYRQLGSPSLTISGEVLTDLYDENKKIDWISRWNPNLHTNEIPIASSQTILLCGGCDLDSVAHYVHHNYKKTVLHLNTARESSEIRRDHSSLVRRVFNGMTDDDFLFLQQLGYESSDFQINIPPKDIDVAVFSFWTDMFYSLYEVVGRGYEMPLSPTNLGHANIEDFYETEIWARGATEVCVRNFRFAKANLKYKGKSNEKTFKENVHSIIKQFPTSTKIFLLSALENIPEEFSWTKGQHNLFNSWQNDIIENYENVKIIKVDDFLENPEDAITSTHFTRNFYRRLGEYLRNISKLQVI
ncbi:HAD family phosphatase [Acetobacter tropicalis]|uniref:HAD-IIIC family phosphatase n=1 Tax=Acetobacter tropicalis TaxID=104102 RepID=A0A511FSM8_9PROT|nr:HAD-IIIC family phosphatase [Acetobacter tropicalis]GAL96070.1 HAD family phosphatase [Acetobacter tropicalis]GEL51951.1 hypothetical protein ATR01nite_30260 [Acetobacter tropicalis]